MLQDSCKCDPNTLSMFQPKVSKTLDYLRNTIKQSPDVGAIYKYNSRSRGSNIDKIAVTNTINVLIDRNVIKKKN